MELRPGTRIADRYEVQRERRPTPLYRVFDVRDAGTGVDVELWVVDPSLVQTPGARDRLVVVGSALQAIRGKYLRRVLDAGESAGEGAGPWLALAHVAGQSLADRLQRGLPATDPVVAYLAQSLAEGLEAGHASGLVHGYLRPGDVHMAGELPRIGGMGMWEPLDRAAVLAALRREQHLLSPEVRAGEPATARSDVYSLAVVLAEVAFGVAAESTAEAAILRERLRRERPRLDGALGRAFSASPVERPPSARALAAQLSDLVPRVRRPSQPSAPAVAVVGGAGVAAAGGGEGSFELGAEPATVRMPSEEKAEKPVVTFRPRDLGTLPEPPAAYPRASNLSLPVPDLSVPVPVPVVDPLPVVVTAPPAVLPSRPALPRAVTPIPDLAPRRRGLAARWLPILAAIVGAAVAAVIAARPDRDPAPAPAAAPAPAPAPVAVPAPAPAPAAARAEAAFALCPDAMVLVSAPAPFCIDAHEAPGAGRLPAAGMALADAAAACAATGKRLCAAAEWELACRGPNRASWPYGGAFSAARCNVRRGDDSTVAPAGARPECVSAAGAFDMSGNVAEWVAEGHTRGGSALDGDDGRCSRRGRREDPAADVGYRCCAVPAR